MSRFLTPHWFGRRGAFLFAYGVAWVLLGYARLAVPPSSAALRAIEPLLYVAPYRTWAALWFVMGVLAIIAAFFRKPGQDIFGYISLMVPPVLWGVSGFITYINGVNPQGLLATSLWGAVVAAIVIVAGWPEIPNGKR